MTDLLYDEPIGQLSRLSGDKILFTFLDDYLKDPEKPTLSQSFFDHHGEIITASKITQTKAPAFFSNLLPDGPAKPNKH